MRVVLGYALEPAADVREKSEKSTTIYRYVLVGRKEISRGDGGGEDEKTRAKQTRLTMKTDVETSNDAGCLLTFGTRHRCRRTETDVLQVLRTRTCTVTDRSRCRRPGRATRELGTHVDNEWTATAIKFGGVGGGDFHRRRRKSSKTIASVGGRSCAI